MTALLYVLAVLLVLMLAVVISARIFGRLYYNDRRPDTIYFCQTEDGWNLSLYHYRPPAEEKQKTPVICCHGLNGNHHGFDLTADTSLARTLADAGHPTFLLNLRGAGRSDKGGRRHDRPLNWRLSHHYRYDAPAAIDKVRKLTGADRVHWIGHSMGGMTAYAFLQGSLANKVSRCVILASPSTFDRFRPAHRLTPLIRWFSGIPVRTLSQSVAPLFEYVRLLQVVSGNVHLERGVSTRSAANCQGQLPTSLLLDFARFVEHGHMLDDDGNDVVAGMDKIKTPTLFIVGEDDHTAVVESVETAYQAFGSEEKKLVLLGSEHGHRSEYGHMTILVGPHVKEEVFPSVLEWLAEG